MKYDVNERARRRGQSGVSLIEALIAVLLLLFIALGILPLMTRAMVNNLQGHQSTALSNIAKSRIEEYMQFGFNSFELTLTTGTELVVDDWYSAADQLWYVGVPNAGDIADFTRSTTVRQYTVQQDPLNPGPPIGPLDASVSTVLVHLKEIEVTAATTANNTAIGRGKQIMVRAFKAQ